MVWITTDDGLVRYDSKKFRFFQHQPSDSQTIASNFTDQMVLDNNNQLWIVTGSGLDIFNPDTEIFKHCFIKEGNKIITAFSPESVFYDKAQNKIWVGTWQGLYYTQPGSAELKKAGTDAVSAPLGQMVFIDIISDHTGGLWLCNANGFFNYKPSSGHITQYHVPEQDEKIVDDDGAFCLYAADDETLWIGTWVKGLVRYNIKTNKGQHYYFADKNNVQNGIKHIVKTGLPQEENILWISTPATGLGTFDMKKGQFTFYASSFENDKNGIKGITTGMLPTATEGMWIASENGLHRYDYSKQLFREIDLSKFNPVFSKAFSPENLSFLKSAAGTDSLCWFNIPYVGSYVYDFAKDKLGSVPPGIKKYLGASIYAMFIDANNVAWVGTDKFGLVAYDIVHDKLLLPEGKYFSQEWDWVTGFFEDSKKRLWLATYNGLFVINTAGQPPQPVTVVNEQLAKLDITKNIAGITEASDGKIWFTAGGSIKWKDGIGVYDAAKNTASFFYDNDSEAAAVLKGLQLHDIVCSNNDMYAATTSGLLRFKNNTAAPGFTLLTTKDGLVNNYIEQLLKDKTGNIWCSSVFGIACFLPGKNFFINYSYTSSGLGPQKTPYMILPPWSDKIYISQQGAIHYFNPNDITVGAAPVIQFTGLQLFNKNFGSAGKKIRPGDIIRLKYFENMITAEFAAMSFSNSDDNQYAHMLQGLEKEWSISKENTVSYTNLAPGKYTLLVKAANSSGVWTEQPVALTFIISPPFWKTWWFTILLVAAAAGILYALYRYRINQLLRMQQMQNTISRNLHDEIGSTLTSISILSNVSQQAMEKEPEQAKEMLRKISAQSKTIQQNMGDIVWAIRSDNDKIENLLVRMREYAAQTLEPLLIKTTLLVDETLLHKMLPMEARKEVLLIYREALNNIAKHSGATIVTIKLQKNKQQVLFAINDNGSWKGNGKSSGTGMGSMQLRAKAVGGTLAVEHTEAGTSVVLQLPIT